MKAVKPKEREHRVRKRNAEKSTIENTNKNKKNLKILKKFKKNLKLNLITTTENKH